MVKGAETPKRTDGMSGINRRKMENGYRRRDIQRKNRTKNLEHARIVHSRGPPLDFSECSKAEVKSLQKRWSLAQGDLADVCRSCPRPSKRPNPANRRKGGVQRFVEQRKLTEDHLAFAKGQDSVGLFATCPVPKGTRLCMYSGKVLPDSRVGQLQEGGQGNYEATFDGPFAISDRGKPPGLAASANSMHNSGKAPNAALFLEICSECGRRTLWLEATQNLDAGTEILLDYPF